MTTGVPAPLIALASRLLLLSRWSRQTGLEVVVARAPAAKRPSLRAHASRRTGLHEDGGRPDEDSALD